MTYAANTKVPVERTKAEIETLLKKYGAKSFGWFTDPGKAMVAFALKERHIRFDLPLPPGDTEKDRRVQRERWRALLLTVKAKLESVESKIETFKEAFLAHIIMPDGRRVYETAGPAIGQAYQSGKAVPLLPPP